MSALCRKDPPPPPPVFSTPTDQLAKERRRSAFKVDLTAHNGVTANVTAAVVVTFITYSSLEHGNRPRITMVERITFC